MWILRNPLALSAWLRYISRQTAQLPQHLSLELRRLISRQAKWIFRKARPQENPIVGTRMIFGISFRFLRRANFFCLSKALKHGKTWMRFGELFVFLPHPSIFAAVTLAPSQKFYRAKISCARCFNRNPPCLFGLGFAAQRMVHRFRNLLSQDFCDLRRIMLLALRRVFKLLKSGIPPKIFRL